MSKMDNEKTTPQNKNFFLILIILAVVIVLEIIVVISKTREEKVSELPKAVKNVIPVAKGKKGSLEFALDSNQVVKAGQNVKAQLFFESPAEPIAGVDVVLTFDPQLISVVDIVGNKDLFEQLIVNHQEQQTGRLKITAYLPKKTLLGKYSLASFTVRPLKDQPAVLDIEFLGPDRITDSNLVSQKTQLDILGSVLSLKLTPETK